MFEISFLQLAEHTYLFYGAGEAGLGIAELVRQLDCIDYTAVCMYVCYVIYTVHTYTP